MGKKILSLAGSIGAIIIGIILSQNSNRLFYGLIIAGILYGIYDIYLIITHKQKTQEQQNTQRKLSEQKSFNNNEVLLEKTNDDKQTSTENINPESATIIVHWFKEKMGLGSLPIYINGKEAGIIKKDNLQVTFHTNVPFNVINMGVYKAEIELSPGDTVEYFVAGNGIRNERTILTKNVK
jgi:hypothetical protein